MRTTVVLILPEYLARELPNKYVNVPFTGGGSFLEDAKPVEKATEEKIDDLR